MHDLDDESLLARLPRRGDDEPPTLRKDLLDEVRDYLQSAWEEQQRQTPDPHEAWQLVLQRFGDPAKLVRKLWFDALKEQIMSRRLILAAFGLAAVMFVAFAAINLRMLSALETTLAGAQQTNALLVEKLESLQLGSQQSNALLVSKLELVQSQSDEANTLLTENLKTLQSASKLTGGAALTWRHLRLKLSAEDQSPVIGTATLSGNPLGESSSGGMLQFRDAFSRDLDAEGRVDFGLIHVGTYSVNIQLKNGYSTLIPQVTLMPGEDRDLSITCPVMPERMQKVTLKFVPPTLKESKLFPTTWKIPDPESLWLLCRINDSGRRIGDHFWSRPFDEVKYHSTLLVNSRGEAFEVDWRVGSTPPTEVAQLGPIQIIKDVHGRPWNGVLPARDYRRINTELVQLYDRFKLEYQFGDELSADHTPFRNVPRDSVDLPALEPVDVATFDLSDTTDADDGPVIWTLPINDSVLPSNPGTGGGHF